MTGKALLQKSWNKTVKEESVLTAISGQFQISQAQDKKSDDRGVLMDFYHSTAGPHWKCKENWGSAKPLNEWFGVGTNEDGRVTAMNLDNNGLTGEIPKSVEQLSKIRSLTLESNALEGTLPESLRRWRNLIELKLSFNRLSGEIPLSIGHLKSLKRMCISNNKLGGEIPQSITNCYSLVELQLQCNEIKGHAPDLAGCRCLKDFRLYDNALIGAVPCSYWQNLPDLQVFSVAGNSWSNTAEVIKGFDKQNAQRVFLSI